MTAVNRSTVRILLKILVLSVFLVGNFFNLNSGWADNGDFQRIMTWFTSAPARPPIYPKQGSQEYRLRYFDYWIPYWKLDFPNKSKMFVSVVLLWAPGVYLNRYFYSAYTLYLPILSLGSRVLLFLFLWLTLRWIDHRAKIPEVHILTLGLPLALLFSTTDVAAYYNSFYQETGTIVFLPYLFGVIAIGQSVERNWRFYLAYTMTVFLTTTSKSSLLYLPVITIPWVISLEQLRRKARLFIPLGMALVIIPVIAGLVLTDYKTKTPNRPYNSLMVGTLLFSNKLPQQLELLGLADARDCVGVQLYTEPGRKCMEQVKDRMEYGKTLRSILFEPSILLRQLDLATNTIQNLTNELGLYARDDPAIRQGFRLNLWSELKARYFPRGWLLLLVMAVFAALLWIGYRRSGLARELAPVGFICLVGFWIDILVQILGDGPRDLLKHLLTANLYFDFLLLAALNIGVAFLIEKFQTSADHV